MGFRGGGNGEKTKDVISSCAQAMRTEDWPGEEPYKGAVVWRGTFGGRIEGLLHLKKELHGKEGWNRPSKGVREAAPEGGGEEEGHLQGG